jgi:hypothetical protein
VSKQGTRVLTFRPLPGAQVTRNEDRRTLGPMPFAVQMLWLSQVIEALGLQKTTIYEYRPRGYSRCVPTLRATQLGGSTARFKRGSRSASPGSALSGKAGNSTTRGTLPRVLGD